MKQVALFIFSFSISVVGLSQNLTGAAHVLDEITINADRNLSEFSNTQTLTVLNDTLTTRSNASLTDLLGQNTGVYFKENGLGMVSSVSFRGTTAQQTAVVWNGININSQFNGQTDFNTVNIRNFDKIAVRSGGGSVLYGSGAIGGTIHLNNTIAFNEGLKNNFLLKYGSFNTKDLNYALNYSNKKISANVSLSYNASNNDYKYVNSDRYNLNGAFYNVGLSTSLGYKIDTRNTLYFYSYVYGDERHFSLILPSETPTKYRNYNTRNMLEWQGGNSHFGSTLKLAYLTENYKYFAHINSDSFSYGNANTLMGNYQLGYYGFKDMLIKSGFDISHTEGQGTSIDKSERTISGFNFLFKQKIKKLLYEATFRKEITQNYKSPLLFNLGVKYKFGHTYTLSANGSKNFRIPTYNDLYWAGSGNLDLKPETSYNLEIGNNVTFKNLQLNITGFYNDITNLIRWLPKGSQWAPTNTNNVVTYGLETKLVYIFNLDKHRFNLKTNYAYTVSEDNKLNKQLIYVPYHKAFSILNYGFEKFSAYWQSYYTGKVFLLSNNNPQYVLNDYLVHNCGTEYKLKSTTFGVQIRNIFNKNYQSMSNRFMPGINYNFYLNFNF
ncbi:MAG: TonB-dependent receptor plug domain-containing protein [Aestuariibaculum sp.]